jgi:membrane fusion protein, heavy metal efflux system
MIVKTTFQLALIILFFCTKADANSENEKSATPLVIQKKNELFVPHESPLRKRLLIQPVTETDSPHAANVSGLVEANPSHIVNILPPLTGRVNELFVSLGEQISQGQLLATIQSPDLALAYADKEKAQDVLDLTKKALDRSLNVHRIGANAVKDIEQIQSNYAQALAEFTRAESRLKILTDNLPTIKDKMLGIKAPIAGTITALTIGQGAYINDATVPLMTLSNIDNLWVTANIPEDLLSSISQGQTVNVHVYAYPDKNFQGTISFINPIVEPDTHRVKARIAFTNLESLLKPGMYAAVSVEIPQSKLIIVPTSALLMRNDKTTVFVETKPWTFIRQAVELGYEDDNHVRILSGLKTNDRVVDSGGILLNDY